MVDTAAIAEDLCQRWKTLNEHVSEDILTKWWDVIESKYTSEDRKYHTLIHLHKMFQHMDMYEEFLQSPQAVSYAIFFHDLLYDPKIQDNEEKCVKQFEDFSAEAGIVEDSEVYSKVIELILLTITHSTEEHKTEGAYGKEDKHFFLDFDMSILGSSPNEYDIYADQIREEYSFIPESIYKGLRAKVLKTFLQIPNIFVTQPFREKYEQQARENLTQEISKLA